MTLSRLIQTFKRALEQSAKQAGEFNSFPDNSKIEKENTNDLPSLINELLENVDLIDNLFSNMRLKMK